LIYSTYRKAYISATRWCGDASDRIATGALGVPYIGRRGASAGSAWFDFEPSVPYRDL
jgi:hypothetical protein